MTWDELYQQLGNALKANPSLASDEARFLQNWTDYEIDADEQNGITATLTDNDIDYVVDIIDNIEYTREKTIVLTS